MVVSWKQEVCSNREVLNLPSPEGFAQIRVVDSERVELRGRVLENVPIPGNNAAHSNGTSPCSVGESVIQSRLFEVLRGCASRLR